LEKLWEDCWEREKAREFEEKQSMRVKKYLVKNITTQKGEVIEEEEEHTLSQRHLQTRKT
jgi:hypothetical protein